MSEEYTSKMLEVDVINTQYTTWIKYWTGVNPPVEGDNILSENIDANWVGVAYNKSRSLQVSTDPDDYIWTSLNGNLNNFKLIYLYSGQEESPSYTGTVSYNFSTGVISPTIANWHLIQTTTDMYVTTAVANSNSTTDEISSSEWSTPVKLNNGESISSASIFLYKRSATTPSKPNISLYYNFLDGNLYTGAEGEEIYTEWTKTVPVIDENKYECYFIQATALTNTVNSREEILVTEWTDPGLYVVNGVDGYVCQLDNPTISFMADSNYSVVNTSINFNVIVAKGATLISDDNNYSINLVAEANDLSANLSFSSSGKTGTVTMNDINNELGITGEINITVRVAYHETPLTPLVNFPLKINWNKSKTAVDGTNGNDGTDGENGLSISVSPDICYLPVEVRPENNSNTNYIPRSTNNMPNINTIVSEGANILTYVDIESSPIAGQYTFSISMDENLNLFSTTTNNNGVITIHPDSTKSINVNTWESNQYYITLNFIIITTKNERKEIEKTIPIIVDTTYTVSRQFINAMNTIGLSISANSGTMELTSANIVASINNSSSDIFISADKIGLYGLSYIQHLITKDFSNYYYYIDNEVGDDVWTPISLTAQTNNSNDFIEINNNVISFNAVVDAPTETETNPDLPKDFTSTSTIALDNFVEGDDGTTLKKIYPVGQIRTGTSSNRGFIEFAANSKSTAFYFRGYEFLNQHSGNRNLTENELPGYIKIFSPDYAGDNTGNGADMRIVPSKNQSCFLGSTTFRFLSTFTHNLYLGAGGSYGRTLPTLPNDATYAGRIFGVIV